MTLSLDTAYRSFGGEVEASSTPTICRLSDSRRHQLWAIAHVEVLPKTRPADAGIFRGFEVLPKTRPADAGIFQGFEVLPKTRPADAGIFQGLAHAGGGADEPFNRDIGALLPIALWGRTSLYNDV